MGVEEEAAELPRAEQSVEDPAWAVEVEEESVIQKMTATQLPTSLAMEKELEEMEKIQEHQENMAGSPLKSAC